MRTLVTALLLTAALCGLPERSHAHGIYVRPTIGFGYAYHIPFGSYGPYWSPWHGPRVGVGIRVGQRYPVRRAAAQRNTEQALKLYIYPAAGQTAAQTADDRYECHVWAADQSGHDPTLGAGTRAEAEDYTRAFTACMEGRNYVVK